MLNHVDGVGGLFCVDAKKPCLVVNVDGVVGIVALADFVC